MIVNIVITQPLTRYDREYNHNTSLIGYDREYNHNTSLTGYDRDHYFNINPSQSNPASLKCEVMEFYKLWTFIYHVLDKENMHTVLSSFVSVISVSGFTGCIYPY